MDGNWFNKVVRIYDTTPERTEAVKKVMEQNDPRICPAEVEFYTTQIWVTMPKLKHQAIKYVWRQVDLPALKQWCETLYEDYAKLGVVLYDITSGNVLMNGHGEFILIDYEQFHPYSPDLYEARKKWMFEQIHEVGDRVKANL